MTNLLSNIISTLFPQKASKTHLKEATGFSIFDDDEEIWTRLTGDYQRDLLPIERYRMQRIASYLWETNLIAARLIELPISYMLAEGVRLVVKDDDELQTVLDRFWNDPVNEMNTTLEEFIRGLSLYGELCLPAFVNPYDGKVRLGYLDPMRIGKVIRAPGNSRQIIGVISKPDAEGNSLRYKTIFNTDENIFSKESRQTRAKLTNGDCFYFRINALPNGKRGLSDLHSSADWLDGYDQFLFGELDRAQFLRAFVWDVTLTGATPDEVKKKARDIVPPKPGSVRIHNDAEKWEAVTPDLKATDNAETAQLFLRHILSGRGIPPHWMGDSGDVNRSTGVAMADPAYVTIAARQRLWKGYLEKIGIYVLRQYRLLFSDSIAPDDKLYTVEAQFPELIRDDVTKHTAALQQTVVAAQLAVSSGLLSHLTAIQIIQAVTVKFGLEFDAAAELQKAQQEAAAQAELDVYREPLGTPNAQ